MKRWFSAICILMITILTVGCGKNSFQPSVSSIYVHKDGRITEAIVENFMQDYYSFDEFQSMVEKEVAAYDNVSIQSLELKDSTVYLLLDFADAETYSKYSEVYCFQGTVDEALSAGLPFAMDFKDEQYEEYSTAEVTEKTSNSVLVLKSEGFVETEQPIKYVSNNVEILGSHSVEVMPIDDEAEYAYIIY